MNLYDCHNKQIISLNGTDRLVFPLDTLVFAVHSMAKVVSHRPFTSRGLASVSGQPIWDSWWTEWCFDRFFSYYFIFPYHYHSTIAPYISSAEYCSYQDNWAKLGSLQTKECSCEFWGALGRKVLLHSGYKGLGIWMQQRRKFIPRNTKWWRGQRKIESQK